MVGKTFVILRVIRRLSFEYRDPYTLKYARCVWSPFYDVRVDKVERVQRRYIQYALRGFGWTDTYNLPLPPYEQRYALLPLDTLVKRRSIACIMFIFDFLSGGMNSSDLLFALDLNIARYRLFGSLRIHFALLLLF
jgi:hypothetical protein